MSRHKSIIDDLMDRIAERVADGLLELGADALSAHDTGRASERPPSGTSLPLTKSSPVDLLPNDDDTTLSSPSAEREDRKGVVGGKLR